VTGAEYANVATLAAVLLGEIAYGGVRAGSDAGGLVALRAAIRAKLGGVVVLADGHGAYLVVNL